MAFRIFEHFTLPEAKQQMLDVTHLFALKMQRDNLSLFDLQWDEILLRISPEPPENILRALYAKQLEGCIQFAPMMNL